MVNLVLVIPILVSFFVTLFLIPLWTKKAKKTGLAGKDVHKKNAPEIAEAGGVTVVAGFAFGILMYIGINTFLFNNRSNFVELFALTTTVISIAFIAFTDDILGWKIGLRRRTRLLFVAFATIPLIAINAGKSVVSIPLFGVIDLGVIYPLVFIPIGIVGATTTFNFLAGFNGLEAGQGVIILTSLATVALLTKSPWLAFIALIMVSALLAFLIFNFCPARVLPGDSLTYATGSLIAIISILGNFERIAVFFFIPIIIETILKSRGKLVKESFGKLEKDGSLSLRYKKIYSLNHLSIFLMQKYKIRPTERKVVLSIWLFQIIVVIIGFIIFRRGIVL